MFKSPDLASLSPAILMHLFFALGALVLGPVALWLRKGTRGHRALGYAWVTLMAGAALSSVFIRDFRLPNLAGYTPIHLLTLLTFTGLAMGIWHVANRRIVNHRRWMVRTYLGVCIAGLVALLPQRYLGSLVWHHWLGLV